MAEDLKRYIFRLMSKVDGLYGIAITDRDGVPVLKVSNENAPELALRPGFLVTFSMAADQGSKMGLGKNQRIVCMYSAYQVVHFNKAPLMVTLVANSTANTGMILSLEDELTDALQDLRQAVDVA
ncbi:ragulator complex protein LAMTOR3-A-like [Branchiostoma lanceolatum]|uniref:Ragulator complex protein LAMTOR3-A-like n=2 Tax=Branchiostoma TaxID=7737 RepID=A0A6P4YC08_BRABE|nr:PREDICTED: ragulator complex protein LAMTOR3-A-like [Branchiostoma belcheri]KAI8478069.1 Ragulator complex protein lamtor3 [Branchiostoma belcheri]CAH1246684.1 LAMTOR3 [Branchiostoma lanceolatum]